MLCSTHLFMLTPRPGSGTTSLFSAGEGLCRVSETSDVGEGGGDVSVGITTEGISDVSTAS